MSAPQRASTGFGPASIIATAGGPNFTSGVPSTTVFPLLQTAMVYDARSAKPDANANVVGGSGSVLGATLVIAIEGYNQALSDFRHQSSGYGNLSWTSVGSWATGGNWWDYDDSVGRTGVFVAGLETSTASMPTTGAATYAGRVDGTVFHQGGNSDATHCRCDVVSLTGNAAFTANFGTRNVSGTLTSMIASGTPWNDVAFNSTITGNAFSGTTQVTTAPGSAWSLAANATGTVEGKFFGPVAQEAGAVWTLFDGRNAAIGTLTGKQP